MIRRLTILKPAEAVPQSSLEKTRFASMFTAAFGYVRKINIKLASVKVELLNGMILHSVAFPSREWVVVDQGASTGTVDPPPVGSLVLVAFPYGLENLSGAFIMSSFIDPRNKDMAKLLVEGDEAIVKTVKPGGLTYQYDRENKVLTVGDAVDENLSIRLDLDKKEIELTDWNGNHILLDSSGAVLETEDNTVTMDASGIKMEGKGNTVSLESGKVLINSNLEILQ